MRLSRVDVDVDVERMHKAKRRLTHGQYVYKTTTTAHTLNIVLTINEWCGTQAPEEIAYLPLDKEDWMNSFCFIPK